MAHNVDNVKQAPAGSERDPASMAHLRRFEALPPQTPRGPLLAGIGQRAGVLDIGQGYAVAFRVESCPADDPGPAVDHITAAGAQPVGLLHSVRVGPLPDPATARTLPAVVARLGERGHELGLPTIGVELVFDNTYGDGPLVDVLCVGVLRHEDQQPIGTSDPTRTTTEGTSEPIGERTTEPIGERTTEPTGERTTEPTGERPFARPHWIDALNADDANRLERDNSPEAQRATLLRMLATPNLGDRSWVTDQHDRYAGARSVLAQPENAGMLRIDEETGLGIAVALDSNARMALLNPYLGAQLALAEAYRKVAVTGAEPLAVTDCLSIGPPDDPHVTWQFVEMILGLVDGCRALGVPVTGGDVSCGHRSGEMAMMPTPTVGVLGVIDDVANRLRLGFVDHGDEIWLLGETREELSGSAWADVMHDGHLGGMPPRIDLEAEKRLAALLGAAAGAGVLSSAHALAHGGLARALAEACLRRGCGAEIDLGEGEATVELYAESTARALVSLPGERVGELRRMAQTHRVLLRRLGSVTPADEAAGLAIEGLFAVPLTELRAAWAGVIPAALG